MFNALNEFYNILHIMAEKLHKNVSKFISDDEINLLLTNTEEKKGV